MWGEFAIVDKERLERPSHQDCNRGNTGSDTFLKKSIVLIILSLGFPTLGDSIYNVNVIESMAERFFVFNPRCMLTKDPYLPSSAFSSCRSSSGNP